MPDKPPKRPATSSTRKGNGAGWGGPAKGAAASRGEMQAPFLAGNSAAKGYHDMSKSERLAALDERKWLIAMGQVADASQVQMAAVNSYEDRHVGKAIARTITSFVDDATKLDDAALAAIATGQDAETRH